MFFHFVIAFRSGLAFISFPWLRLLGNLLEVMQLSVHGAILSPAMFFCYVQSRFRLALLTLLNLWSTGTFAPRIFLFKILDLDPETTLFYLPNLASLEENSLALTKMRLSFWMININPLNLYCVSDLFNEKVDFMKMNDSFFTKGNAYP